MFLVYATVGLFLPVLVVLKWLTLLLCGLLAANPGCLPLAKLLIFSDEVLFKLTFAGRLVIEVKLNLGLLLFLSKFLSKIAPFFLSRPPYKSGYILLLFLFKLSFVPMFDEFI